MNLEYWVIKVKVELKKSLFQLGISVGSRDKTKGEKHSTK
jgi:hypothetical protein